MIHDPQRLKEVIDEITEWTLEQRRQYLVDIEKAFGKASADQIRAALKAKWQAKEQANA